MSSTMPIRLALSLLLVSWIIPSIAYADSACARLKRPTLPRASVVPLWGDIRYDNSRTVEEITALFRSQPDGERERSTPDLTARGLTTTEFTASIDVEVVALPLENTRHSCVWPSAVTLKVGYPQFTVYIARQYPPGSCAYDALLEHEEGHIRIDKAALRHQLDSLRRALKMSLSSRFPMLMRSDEIDRPDAMRQIQQDLQPALAALTRERQRNNGAHDSPASYARIQRACARW